MHISIRIFCTLLNCFVLCGLLQSICFRMLFYKHSITFESTYLHSFWFYCIGIFYTKFRFCEIFTVINSVARILLIQTRCNLFRTIKRWFTTLYSNHMYILSSFLAFHIQLTFCTEVIKNIRNIHTVSTNQNADILHFNDKHWKNATHRSLIKEW